MKHFSGERACNKVSDESATQFCHFNSLLYFCRRLKKEKGTASPFFVQDPVMISKSQIIQLAESFLSGSENYLIDVKVSPSNKIIVHIENDQHVSITDCIQLSRHIEHSLDREQEDFELEVSSPGIDQPFRHIRQYLKYLGKEVDVKLRSGIKIAGTLEAADAHRIQILEAPTSKKKTKITHPDDLRHQIAMSDILETRLVIKL